MAGKLGAQLDVPDERCDTYAVDLLDADATQGWAAHVAERFGRIDALIHLVGGWRGGKPIGGAPVEGPRPPPPRGGEDEKKKPIGEAPVEDDEFLHALLVRTVQTATRAFLPHLAPRAGRFAIVSSVQAQAPTSTNAAYASAKAAAEAWTLAFADELAESGGTANIVVVNAIVTPEMRAQNPDKPYKTFTDAQHIAEALAFLLSEAGSKMNGQRLSLHG